MAGGDDRVEEDFLPLPERKKDEGDCPLRFDPQLKTDTLFSSANAHCHAKGIG
jgi:hypothetical protein